MEKFELVFVGPAFSEKITALTSLKDITYVASGNSIYIVDRNVIMSKIELKNEAISSLIVFGDVLIATGLYSIYIFDMKSNSNLFIFKNISLI